MGLLSVGAKHATKALAKQAPDIATKAVKTSDWSWMYKGCLLYTSQSPRDRQTYRMPSYA